MKGPGKHGTESASKNRARPRKRIKQTLHHLIIMSGILGGPITGGENLKPTQNKRRKERKGTKELLKRIKKNKNY